MRKYVPSDYMVDAITNAIDERDGEYVHVEDLPHWIPVSERLPETPGGQWDDGVVVLGWSKTNGMDLAWFERDDLYGHRWHWEAVGVPSHWMPLPEPPEVE